MKILESFDTKLDIEELNEAFNKYWEWKVLLIKRHWIKLLLPLALTLLSIFMLMLMLYSIYIHTFEEHKITFWILAIFYSYTTISWCLFVVISIIIRINYWTKSKTQYIENPEKILDIKKKWFDKFMKRTFLTFWIHTIVLIFNASFPFIYIKTTWLWSAAVAIWILFIDLVFLFLLNRVMYLLIEYEMTFNICTIDWLTTYRQKWFFKSDSLKINSASIKVIKSTKEWIISALFKYWNLCIYTDWDLSVQWGKNLELTYMPDPSALAKRLNTLIEEKNPTSGENYASAQ